MAKLLETFLRGDLVSPLDQSSSPASQEHKHWAGPAAAQCARCAAATGAQQQPCALLGPPSVCRGLA